MSAQKPGYQDDIYKTDGRSTCWWWLRSPGYSSDRATGVDDGGFVFGGGGSVDLDGVALRLAMWITTK